MAQELRYNYPNGDYDKLFSSRPVASQTAPNQGDVQIARSAGWRMPNNNLAIKPVFVAHSLLSAIWLMRKTLGATACDDAV